MFLGLPHYCWIGMAVIVFIVIVHFIVWRYILKLQNKIDRQEKYFSDYIIRLDEANHRLRLILNKKHLEIERLKKKITN